VILKFFLAWFPIILIAFANAALRDGVYGRLVGELAAHQISTVTLGILVGVYFWALSGFLALRSPGQAIAVGLMWLVMTIAFESWLGHFVLGNAWREVLRDYNVLDGRIWVLFLIWLVLLPYVHYVLRVHYGADG
jgi:hypothetical protein